MHAQSTLFNAISTDQIKLLMLMLLFFALRVVDFLTL